MTRLLLALLSLAWPTVQPVRHFCIRTEILDPSELRYYLNKPRDLPGDLRALAARAVDLHGTPFTADADRFPPLVLCQAAKDLNCRYRRSLELRQWVERRRFWECEDRLSESRWLYQVWDTASDCQSRDSYVVTRRHALKKLRELIGDECYYAGDLPPCVPVWRFSLD